MHKPFRRLIASALAVVMTVQPVVVMANASGIDYDAIFANKESIPTGTDDIVTNNFDEASSLGQAFGEWGLEEQIKYNEFQQQDVFSGEGGASNFSGAFPDVETLEGVGDDKNAMEQAGVQSAQNYRSGSDGIDPAAEAFFAGEEQAKRRPADMSNDPVFNSAGDLFSAMANPDEYADYCAAGGSAGSGEVLVCDEGQNRNASCTATHDYTAGLIEHINGPYNIKSCGTGCIDVWIGKQGDNYRNGGSCTIYTDDIRFKVKHPEAINSARLVQVEYDDHLRIFLDSVGSVEGGVSSFATGVSTNNEVWASPFGWNDNWANGASCERSASHNLQPNVDMTAAFKDELVDFRLVNAVGGKGEAYARIRIDYDPSKVVVSEGWSSDQCSQQAEKPGMEVSCVKGPELDAAGCYMVDDIPICESFFGSEASFPGVSPMCEEVHVSEASYELTAGAPSCSSTVAGRDDCSLIDTECVQDDASGSCEVQRNTYQCGVTGGGFSCDLREQLPDAFEDCQPSYVYTDAEGEELDYHIKDIKTCNKVTKHTSCDLERKVEILEENDSFSRSESCFASRTYAYQPDNAATTIRGNSTLNVTTSTHTSASISAHPSDANGWETQITATGPRETKAETHPAHLASTSLVCPDEYSSFYDSDAEETRCRKAQKDADGNTVKDADGNTVFSTTGRITQNNYDCSTAPSSPNVVNGTAVYGGNVVKGWSLSGTTCTREVSACYISSAPKLEFSLSYEGLYLAQDIAHHPDDEGVDKCIIDSDDWTSAEWQCADTSSKQISSPWGGTESIGPAELSKLDLLYPDTLYQSPHTETKSSSDQLGDSCWWGEGDYNAATGEAEFWLGEGGEYTDIYGDTQTTNNTGVGESELTYNSCQALEDDPQCERIQIKCNDNGSGHEGFCYVENHVYDCGESGQIDGFAVETKLECSGVMRCSGEECYQQDEELATMEEFAEATALLHAVEQMAGDMSCTGVDEDGIPTGTENVECKVFSGKDMECQRPIGSSIHGHDCCDMPADVNLGDYLEAVVMMPRLDAAVMGLEGANAASAAVKGSYTTVRDPIVNTYEAVKKPLVNAAESIADVASPVLDPIKSFYDKIATQVKEGIAKLSQKLGANSVNIYGEVASGGASVGADAAADQAQQSFTEQMLGAGGAQALSVLTTAYTVYTMTMLAIQLVWQCEEEAFMLASQRDLKSCVHVGTYCSAETLGGLCLTEKEAHCCFSSPLSRIINEQGQAQVGRDFGSSENPQCGGFSIEEVANLDWDQIDLSEWIGMLDQHDLMPNANNISEHSVTADNAFNFEGDRSTATERTHARFEDLNPDEVWQSADDQATLPDW